MAGVARNLGMKSINIVPYYYVPNEVGQRYADELKSLGVEAFSWNGFHHEDSGIDYDEFVRQLRAFLADLGEIENFPFMPMNEERYRIWFADATTPALPTECNNVEKLIDIQPDGEANFCVDFPDYSVGNVLDSTITTLWNSDRAERFREYRRSQPLAVCHRCGAKYIAELDS
jgi:radical SAM protein with 4Fe4S-binding SPASM domain